ncbi:DUF4041 domain-containing protein [Larkinella insperata]|uniref:DUF4041 domain-containing protein n=1 Tax=Larkinella insperata TaxID=332158 RepID=A0ABW3Q914_9BACT|nr:DUF4041 domain-containing protein [Larkinella insperata]
MNTTLLLAIIAGLSIALILVSMFTISSQRQLRKELEDKTDEVQRLQEKYAPIINLDEEIESKTKKIDLIKMYIEALQAKHDLDAKNLSEEYRAKRAIYENLLKEVAIVEENLGDISYGLYKPHYNFASSERYKAELDRIWAAEKRLIKEGKAIVCATTWSVSGSYAEGAKMTSRYSKLMLRAFNGECDSAIAKVSWNNIVNMEARIEKSFTALNALGESHQISITYDYYQLKLSELRLEFELQEKIHQEKEEQKLIKEQMREEEKALREIEIAQKKAADEELRYQKALEKARQDVQYATGAQMERLADKIKELEILLSAAHQQKEKAMSMAQMTKSGHVYVISNIGSFGENVYKIGMTRRLDPMDRVRELGDASVPFSFDVHALVYCDNAPELENALHRKFADNRLNLINNRREFFHVNIDQIEQTLLGMGHSLTLTKLAEAREYRETLSIRETKNKPLLLESQIMLQEQLPISLD